MTKTQQKNLTKSEKYDRQKALARERVRKHRAKLSEEELEKKRQYDRDRYNTLKEQGKTNPIGSLKPRDRKQKRKNWKIASKKYRQKKANEKRALENTPPDSENEQTVSLQKERGRKCVRRDRALAYKKIKKQEEKITNLERRIKKYQKRLEREKKKKKDIVCSPSPNTKVSHLVGRDKVSPDVKKRLFIGFALETQLKTQVAQNKPKSKERQLTLKAIGTKILRKFRVQRYLKEIINYKANKLVDESNAFHYEKKKYKSKIINEAKSLRDFFEDDSVSRMCPGKKDVKRCGKIKKQRRVLQSSMRLLFKQYITKTGSDISYTTFTRARPFWVVPPTLRDRDTCACVVHSNMELIFHAMKTINAIEQKNIKELIDNTVCSKKNMNCMYSKCNKCKKLEFKDMDDVNVKIQEWKTITEIRTIKGVEKKIKKVVKSKDVTKFTKLKEKFCLYISKFKKHVYDMVHQAKHKSDVRDNLKEGEVMFLIDFSENYNAKYAQEIQSMHFGASKRQISLHTGIRYHSENGKIISKGFCTVSDCLDHQSHGVWAHFDPVLKQTAEMFPDTHTVHVFSDSPSSQYRNRCNLHLMMTLLPGYFPGLKKTSWNFSEPGHGKGPMDGIGGTLKRRADEHVLHNSDITCAKEFVSVFQNSKIWVLEIPSDRMEEMKNKLKVDIPPVKDIMKMKQIMYQTKDSIMRGRSLSCKDCMEDEVCSHYGIGGLIFNESLKKKRKLKVEEVYSSDDDSTKDKYDDIPETDFSDESLKPGVFVLVRFSTKKTSRQFVGICKSVGEGDDEHEPEVVFLKPVGSDKKTFVLNENDTSSVTMDQIVAILPAPTKCETHRRAVYKFKWPIDID